MSVFEVVNINFDRYQNRFCLKYTQYNFDLNKFEEVEDEFDSEEEMNEMIKSHYIMV